jgi:integrase
VEQKEIFYLTADELKKMIDTPTTFQVVFRQVFLFGCYTGLRIGDMLKIKWADIKAEKLYVKQQKTKAVLYIDLHPMAQKILAEIRENQTTPNDFVFGAEVNERSLNNALKRWAKKAEIDKNIHIHVARHTFATLLLANGIDLYTVSKMLGHKSIQSTQIYAKVMDIAKQTAIQTLPNF